MAQLRGLIVRLNNGVPEVNGLSDLNGHLEIPAMDRGHDSTG